MRKARYFLICQKLSRELKEASHKTEMAERDATASASQ
jgi:hypothetical protein